MSDGGLRITIHSMIVVAAERAYLSKTSKSCEVMKET